ncbi:cyclin H [Pseudohyphozyma bogoriensis]|nr:cyclin H [Pseudohyphozyma bogoriensis]
MAVPKFKDEPAATIADDDWHKPEAPIPLFTQSSQFRNWRYSKSGLEKIRTELNVTAVQRVRSMVEEEKAEQSSAPVASTSAAPTTEPSRSNSPTPPSEIEYLTVADELSLVTYYLTQVAALCGAFRFPEMVQATAMTYLKRFYLRNTCMDYHPKNVMLTCVFLATKTENFPVSIDSFSSRIKSSPEDILSLEFLVSQSLKFEYKVHHAHVAAYGLSVDMKAGGDPASEVDEAYHSAHKLVKFSRLTDAEFIYTPSQIAIAAFRLVNPSLIDKWIGVKEAKVDSRKAEGKKSMEGEVLAQGELLEYLDEAGRLIQAAEKNPVDKQAVTEVDKRLRWARNPEKDPKSALYKKRKAEEDAEREQKALAKAAKQPPQDDSDVFS